MADFTGTTGNDHITGTDDADFIDVSQGGNDTVDAGGGDDVIAIGGALNKLDRIDGGDGYDVLRLDGDYSSGVGQLGKAVSGIEEIDLAAGHDYHLVFGNSNVAQGAMMTVDASALGAGDSLILDAHKVKDGAVTLIGGAGDDTLIGASRGHALNVLNGGGGDDTIYSDSRDFDKTVGGPHTIDGGTGNDTIYCIDGDTVQGGDGNDAINFSGYFHGDNNSLTAVDAGAGDDVVTIHTATFGLGGLQGGAGTDQLTIQGVAHLLMPEFSAATSGFEIVVGGGLSGDDTNNTIDLSGFAVSEVLGVYGGGGDDILIGASSKDGLAGGDGDDTLSGGAGDDYLSGEDGKDQLTGGLGRDVLFGGNDADSFIYTAIDDSPLGTRTHDTIKDFHHSEGDRIDLSAIDADATQDGNQAFHLGGSAFTDSPGELIQFVDAHGHTMLEGDVNGDGVADFEIQLGHRPILSTEDFVL